MWTIVNVCRTGARSWSRSSKWLKKNCKSVESLFIGTLVSHDRGYEIWNIEASWF